MAELTRVRDLPDERGHFGPYGGVFVAETLVAALDEQDALPGWGQAIRERPSAGARPAA